MLKCIAQFALAFSAGALLAACAPTPTPEPAPPLEEPLPIRITLTPFLSNAPLYIASAEGYFEEARLQPEYVPVERSSEAIPALAQGEIDVTAGSLTANFLNAINQGAEIKFVADKGYVDPEGCYTQILANNDIVAAGGFDNPDAFIGQTIRYNEGAFSHYVIDVAMTRRGLDLDDYTRAEIPSGSIAGALGTGELGMAVATEPLITQTIEQGAGAPILNVANEFPNLGFTFIAFGPSILEDNPEIGRRFMVAYLRAVRQHNEGKTDRNVDILAEALDLTPEFLKTACWMDFRSDLQITTDDIVNFQDWAFDKGYLDDRIAVERIVDTQFLEYALAEVDN